MKIITWNVNSITMRLSRLKGVLDRHAPDVVCLQETKVTDDKFPSLELRACGYQCAFAGQKAYNGVAILVRDGLTFTDVQHGFVGDPTPDDARVISATVDGTRVIGVYVINGQSPGSDRFIVKLQWLTALREWIANTSKPTDRVILCGDFNIAPDERDVYDPPYFRGRLLCTDEERERLKALFEWGFDDLLRCNNDQTGLYSWWDYRYGAFHRNNGLRIDLILGTKPVATDIIALEIDRAERKSSTGEGKPSDHAPVIASIKS